tara:strand:- start:671 stop:925 length:255 start_codon:yes stop_codon:yes gene_type:complete
MLSAQNQFSVGDLVRWKANITTANPRKGYVGSVEILGIVKRITTQLELKVLNADKGGVEYLNALKDMSAWEKLPVYMDECEVMA